MLDFGLGEKALVKFSPTRLGYITKYVEPLECDTGLETARNYFNQNPDWSSIPIEKDGGVVGLVKRETVFQKGTGILGTLTAKSLDAYMQEQTQIVDGFEDVDRALSRLLAVDVEHVGNDFLIYHRGRYLGVGRILDLVKHADDLRRHDMAEAERVQRHMIDMGDAHQENFRVHRSLRMAHELGGDFSQILDLGRGRTLVTCFDVSGKGVSAALMTGVISAYFATLHVSGRLERIGPEETVRMLNSLVKSSSSLGKFVVGALAFIDIPESKVTLYNIGLGPLYVFWTAEDGREKLNVIEPDSAPLGLEDEADFTGARKILPLLRDLRIFIHSDGLSEARNPDGAMFGEEAVKQLLVSARGLRGADVIKAVDKRITDYISTAPQADDISSIFIDFRS